jgi:hypothetical protein
METTIDREIRYLQDIHAAEKLAGDLLDKLADDDDAIPELKLVCGEAARECDKRRATIIARVTVLGGQISGLKDFTNSVVGLVSDIWNSAHDREDKITMDAIKIHAALHVVHASYVALHSYAGFVNDNETEAIAGPYAEEAMRAAERMIPAIGASARSMVFIPTPS